MVFSLPPAAFLWVVEHIFLLVAAFSIYSLG
jgi:hypothetical protein